MNDHSAPQVASVCPDCLRPISGHLVEEKGEVRLVKHCPQHGTSSTTLWRGEPAFSSWQRPKLPYGGGPRRPVEQGCPRDCGLCADHRQRTCTALVEITSRCNLGCPVCFAASGGQGADLPLATLEAMFAGIMRQTGGCNLQLSGGEPTVRDDLAEIVALARRAGFTFIQLNSNGLRLAADRELAPRLRDQGLSSVFLQFDDVGDEASLGLRGRALFAEKCRAIDNLAAAGLGVVLVPTLVRGLNSGRLWEMVRFALQRMPAVRGIHFQPISYFGRYPEEFTPDHLTLPEIIQGLVRQSGGLLRVEDFHPPGCEHALCSFSARYLVEEDGHMKPLGGSGCDCAPRPAEEGARTSIAVTARQWAAIPMASQAKPAVEEDDLDRFLRRAASHSLTISAMAFQDCWNLDLERLRGCCIHVAQEDGRLIPFCSYNLTSRDGVALHRRPSKPTAGAVTRDGACDAGSAAGVGAAGEVAKGAAPAASTSPRPVKTTTIDALVARRLSLSEPLSRHDLDQAQLRLLRQLVRHARANSPFYRRHLDAVDLDRLRSRADLATLPLLSAGELTLHGQALLALSQAEVARVVTLHTSGSTGAAKRVAYGRDDLEATADFFRCGMGNLVASGDRVLVLLPHQLPDSVGQLLIDALREGGISADGHWPPRLARTGETAALIERLRPTCLVGLPQHLLALAEAVGRVGISTMLLCSDYAAPALRRRIEAASGAITFLHYGSTESGLGGGVECSLHCGCHLRESELLVEIVDPLNGAPLADGELGEVVFTTLARRTMPLLRYRSGDLARLDRSPCRCGGVTARLTDIRGRLGGCPLPGGATLHSRDLDDLLFAVPGLLDYRIALHRQGGDRLHGEFVFSAGTLGLPEQLRDILAGQPAISAALATGELSLAPPLLVDGFAPTHTVKRTIIDHRHEGEPHASRP